MRLIDADALEDKAKQYSLGYYEEDEWAVPFKEIGEAPTIDAIPIRPQGEWIKDPINKNNMYCSNCKVSYTKDFLRGMSLYHEPKDTPHFCPNCGARMRGADDE